MHHINSRLFYAAIFFAFGFLFNSPVYAQAVRELDELSDVDIVEHLDEFVPQDIPFLTDDGEAGTIGDYFVGERPVILTMGFYRCPLLCPLTLSGLVKGLNDLDETPGNEFRIVTVSIDPTDKPEFSRVIKDQNLSHIDREGAEAGWTFLTGNEDSIGKLADSIGFQFKYDEETQQYLHAAGIFILTPNGKISRYLYGMDFDANTMRMALLEASQGKIGTTIDRILLFCYHYDPETGKYTPMAMNIAQLGSAATLVFFGVLMGSMWIVRKKKAGNGEGPDNPGDDQTMDA
jgi:protein SCO1/2